MTVDVPSVCAAVFIAATLLLLLAIRDSDER